MESNTFANYHKTWNANTKNVLDWTMVTKPSKEL